MKKAENSSDEKMEDFYKLLNKYRIEGTFCDVALWAKCPSNPDNVMGPYSAHKVVLASACPSLAPVMTSQNIALDAADSETLPVLLTWVYGQKEDAAKLITSVGILDRLKYLAKCLNMRSLTSFLTQVSINDSDPPPEVDRPETHPILHRRPVVDAASADPADPAGPVEPVESPASSAEDIAAAKGGRNVSSSAARETVPPTPPSSKKGKSRVVRSSVGNRAATSAAPTEAAGEPAADAASASDAASATRSESPSKENQTKTSGRRSTSGNAGTRGGGSVRKESLPLQERSSAPKQPSAAATAATDPNDENDKADVDLDLDLAADFSSSQEADSTTEESSSDTQKRRKRGQKEAPPAASPMKKKKDAAENNNNNNINRLKADNKGPQSKTSSPSAPHLRHNALTPAVSPNANAKNKAQLWSSSWHTVDMAKLKIPEDTTKYPFKKVREATVAMTCYCHLCGKMKSGKELKFHYEKIHSLDVKDSYQVICLVEKAEDFLQKCKWVALKDLTADMALDLVCGVCYINKSGKKALFRHLKEKHNVDVNEQNPNLELLVEKKMWEIDMESVTDQTPETGTDPVTSWIKFSEAPATSSFQCHVCDRPTNSKKGIKAHLLTTHSIDIEEEKGGSVLLIQRGTVSRKRRSTMGVRDL